MARRRRCKATTKKGARCKAAPQHGHDVCIAHDQEARETGRFGGSQPGAGRPRLPRTMEVARRVVEGNAAVLLRPHLRALGFDVRLSDDGPVLVELAEGGAKVHATHEGEVIVSSHDDLGAMQAAAEKLLDRVYGRPRQAVEHTGAHGGPVEVATDLSRLDVGEKRALLVLLEKAGESGG